MPIFNNILAGASGQATGYEIDQSLRFDDGDSAYLTRTPSSAGNQKTWTYSGWIKKGNDVTQQLFTTDAGTTSTTYGSIALHSSGYFYVGEYSQNFRQTTQLFRDPSAWYHFVVAFDTTESTGSNRVKVYVNGEQITDFSTSNDPTQDADYAWNNTNRHDIGSEKGTGNFFDGYMAEVHFIDGQALTPASFGETNSATNQWVPIEVTGMTYGTNGFYLPFSSTELANSFSNDTYSDAFVPSSNLTVNYLVVAGGGSGGAGDKHNYGGGGGGAGGLLSGSTSVTSGTSYPITVGAGGAAIAPSNSSGAAGNNGSNSVFSSFTAIGGGGGSYASTAAKDGGSGGGGGGGQHAGGDGTSGQGNDGGDADNYQGAGGGGAGGAGQTRSGTTAGAGGSGVDHSGTFGTSYGVSGVFAGGGGGGYNTYGGQGTAPGAGGSGGGGAGGTIPSPPDTVKGTDGTANTGGGGGGGSSYHSGSTSSSDGGSGAGGSGVVLIRYAGSSPQATGGTISTVNISGTDYQVHAFTNLYTDHTITANGDVANARGTNLGTTYEYAESFTSTGTTSWTAPAGVTSVEYLVVGGGGGGGSASGAEAGGGGAGQFQTGTLSVTPGQSYTVTVGAGGSGSSNTSNKGSTGASSVFSSITSTGGGGGGSQGSADGASGASGGGGGYQNGTGGSATSASTGNDGGDSEDSGSNTAGGGGGGSGGAGENGSTDGDGHGGDGGAGTSSSITGTATLYAGGGGGGTYTNGASATGGAGAAGGGNGGAALGSGVSAGGNATANTGSGGGGGASFTGSTASGGNGGSGIVVIAYNKSKPGSSSIKFDGSGDYLSVPDSDDWDFGTGDFTVEHWFRPRSIPSSDTHTTIFSGTSWPPGFRFYYGSSAVPYFRVEGSAYEFTGVTLSADTWYHMAASREGTNLRLFIDGDLKATHTDSTNINSSGVLYIGRRGDTTSDDANVYLDEIRISDTARYTSSFTPSTTAFTADSNTKLLIHSDFNGGIGADNSGNTNDFTPTNLVATDQVLDSPTNNFATLNPIYEDGSAHTMNPIFAEGNLSITATDGNFHVAYSTITIPASGKWYLETYLEDGDIDGVGIVTASGRESVTNGWGMGAVTTAQGFATQANYVNNSSSNNFTLGTGTPSNGDICQLAIDADNNKVWIGLNNSWNDASGGTTGNPSSGTNHTIALTFGSDAQIGLQKTNASPNTGMVANFGQDSSFAGNKTAQGNQDGNGIGDFYYTPPSGFVALCTDNLSDPSIADPTKHFNTILWAGDSTSPRTFTGVGFQPDLSWGKSRTNTYDHNITDSVRGVGEVLTSATGAAEQTEPGSGWLSAFNSDGFVITGAASGTYKDAAWNETGKNYVAWNWKAGGTASSNTDGSITSSVSANTTAGFSIVSYTGNSTAGATVGHGLSQAPELVIAKERTNADSWLVFSEPLGNTKALFLNETSAAGTHTTYWNDTSPSSTVVTLGSDNKANGSGTIIMYCFHSVDGYSKVGSYTANGNADGPFIFTGFRPAYTIIKPSSRADNWAISDSVRSTYNGSTNQLRANNTEADFANSASAIDYLSNGFKIRTSDPGLNNSTSDTYIYLAFAESPFKTSNAR